MTERDPRRLENADALGWPPDEFSADLGHGNELVDHGDTTEELRPLRHHEPLPAPLANLSEVERDRLRVLVQGTRLEQGSTYVDLDDLAGGPFRALAGQRAERGHRLVSKRDVDYDLWNRLVPDDTEPAVVRPNPTRDAGG